MVSTLPLAITKYTSSVLGSSSLLTCIYNPAQLLPGTRITLCKKNTMKISALKVSGLNAPSLESNISKE